MKAESGAESSAATRPVIAPAIGAMPELAASAGASWVHLYEGELTPDALRQAFVWVRETRRDGEPDLDALEWRGIAEATVAGYRDALSRPRRHP
jgi:hypothetical protein